MVRALLIASALLLSAPLAAVKLKLKTDEKEQETTVVRLAGDEVTIRRGRKDLTVRLDDFEPASAYVVRKQFTEDKAAPMLELARFAVHRGLWKEARESAASAVKLDAGMKGQADALAAVADVLEGDELCEQAASLLAEGKAAEARPLLEDVVRRLRSTPAGVRAEVLLGTLQQVEEANRARALEEEARKAQESADADERKKRAPVDDWLAGLQQDVKANGERKLEADRDCEDGKLQAGLPKYDNVIKAAERTRKALAENRHLLTFRGQPEQADTLDQRCLRLMVDTFERWAHHLYRAQRYDAAAEVCARGIALDPKDRRLLALKVDIDEVWDPTKKDG